MRQWRDQFFLCIITILIAGVFNGRPSAAAAAEESSPPAPAPVSIPLGEVAAQAEAAAARLRDVQLTLSSDHITETVTADLPALTREIDVRLRETRKIVAQRPALEMLSRMETDWQRLRGNLADWSRALGGRIARLEQEMAQLDELSETWQRTLSAAVDAHAPPEVIGRIQSTIGAIGTARASVYARRGEALTVQNRVGLQDARVGEALLAIRQARTDILERLFVKDSPALWTPEARARAPQDLLADSRNSFTAQWAALLSYSERQPMRFLLHALIVGLLAAALYRARDPVKRQTAEAAPAVVVDRPLAVALMLSVVFGRLIYPQAPRLLWIALISLALIPGVLVLRRLINGNLRPVFYALVVFFFVDQARALAAAVDVLPRLSFLAEMLGLVGFLTWLIYTLGRGRRATTGSARSRRTIRIAAAVACALACAALAANAAGYVTLANLVGNAVLGSAYLAIILYALVEVIDGLGALALSVRPLALSGVARRHGALIRRRLRRGLQIAAVVLWILGTLNRLLLRERLFELIRSVLSADLGVGFLHITMGDVLSFALTVWAAFLVSRFVRFLLEEDVYPRVALGRGLPYAISTVLHYVILLAGFFAAVAALGFDMTKVTILAGAFSVGVGFGLQNIFNNFVSGLILLFERPVKIGDVVQIDDASGVVEHIGIRASIIRTPNGSEIIVPNGKLISERLTNWTLSNRRRTIELPVSVAQGADPGHVIALLERVAAEHPLVTEEPPPQALVVKLSPDALAFELRAWTGEIERWMQIRSELAINVSATLAAEKIALR
ncbi:MAG TPA: mechanosensitive ion channel domain-containing protein [Verrucomicrobiae bacterium]|jgi:small-conductance mechanosensitive channel|nr:mechanosensitive ion channel domain-containing protein [Verrucomicrobiae bacterium]